MKCFAFMALLFTAGLLRGQSFEVGLYGGVSYYEGDLAPNRLELYYETLHPAFGVLVRANFIRWISFRLAYNHMTVSGDDNLSRRRRRLSFQSDIQELSLSGEISIFQLKLFGDYFSAEPYIFGGAGLFHFNPQAQYNGQWIDLQPLGTEGQGLPRYEDKYALTQWNVLGGAGLKLHFGPRWILGFEASGRKTFTDHLDDVSNKRVIYQDILEGNGSIAAQLSRPQFNPEKDNPTNPYVRGGPATDYYFTVGATITYAFGPDVDKGLTGGGDRVICPKF